MWKSQVYGHHGKMARTKTHRTSQNTQHTLRNYFVCVFRIFLGFFIFNIQLLRGILKTMLNYRLGTVNKIIGRLNHISAAANLTLSQHFLEEKNNVHLLLLTRQLRN